MSSVVVAHRLSYSAACGIFPDWEDWQANSYPLYHQVAMVFPVVMFGRKSCTIKKAEPQRTDAFKLWCWRKLLGVPWMPRRSNQSILKKISPEYSFIGRTDADAEAPIHFLAT